MTKCTNETEPFNEREHSMTVLTVLLRRVQIQSCSGALIVFNIAGLHKCIALQ